MGEEFGNAGSRTHDFGNRARRAVEKARDQVAAVVAAGRGDVVFTSGATESNNLAILGLAEHGRQTGRRHLVSTQIEHNAVLEPLAALTRQGFELTLVPPTRAGRSRRRRFETPSGRTRCSSRSCTSTTRPASCSRSRRSRISWRATPAYFHVDAAQGFGKELASAATSADRSGQHQRAQDLRPQRRRRVGDAEARRPAAADRAAPCMAAARSAGCGRGRCRSISSSAWASRPRSR